MRKIDPILQEKLAKLLQSMGYELWGCEWHVGQSAVFRLYMDGPTGVNTNDCSIVSRQVGAMLDVEDPFQGKYTLEVSSPGIDKPLFEKVHYQKCIGNQIKVRLHAAINQRRQYKGLLKQVDDDAIYLWVEELGQEVKLPFVMIEKANSIGNVHFH